jgi:hypothetical protein
MVIIVNASASEICHKKTKKTVWEIYGSERERASAGVSFYCSYRGGKCYYIVDE